MTIKEMFKKVETYNEVAELVGTEKVELRFWFGYGFSEKAKSYKSLVEAARDTFIDEVADAIINCKEYELNEEHTFFVKGRFGEILEETVKFSISL